MSVTLTITGSKSILQSYFSPSLNIDDDYECGLLYVSVFNSIPNINNNNNIFSYGDRKEVIKIPTGIYDIEDLCEYINKNANDCQLKLKANVNTLSCFLYCDKEVDFQNDHSIAPLIGFPNICLEANKWHESVNFINILPLSVIRIECDLVNGSYTNGLPSHILYEFIPNVPPGHRFIEKPGNIIYFPVNKQNISCITIKIVDLQGNTIDFREEDIVLCLHLRKRNDRFQ